jgi:ATPase subunit of ABC transporter with duplicated ATPase domains
VLLVTHDRQLLDAVTVTRTISVAGGQVSVVGS